jgi:hypothetical protein
MDTACEIIKNYIKSNSVEEVIEYVQIRSTDEEEFETIQEQKEYIIDKLIDNIEEIVSIYNVTIEPSNYIVADLHIANYIKVKLLIGITGEDSNRRWHISTKAIVKYRKN